MNRTVKVILLIAVVLIPVGAILTALGIHYGGKTSWSYGFGKGMKPVSNEIVSDTIDLKDFDSLKLDVASIDVNISEGDSYKLEYTVREGMEPEITEDAGKLTVKQPSTANMGFGFDLNTVANVYNITLPGAGSIDIDAESSSGEITISGINVTGKIKASSGDIFISGSKGKDLSVKTSSGKISCDGVTADSAEFTASSGEIDLSGITADDVLCDTSSGDIDIKDSQVKDVDCEASSGEVKIELDGKEDDYSYDISSSSGDIKVNGHKSEKKYEEDGGKGKIKIKTSSGDIEVSVK
ncbi:MAG: DUF4097 family beta strand repeat protein [Lachnospiraceae bacterium]|nr:DUF4097 family beta strand repeat protein [Lachnospiraceae bacterium]